jgi:hypothetical protein
MKIMSLRDIDSTDELAEKVCRIADDLISGKQNAGVSPYRADLTVLYLPQREGGRHGEWRATVAIKPPRKGDRWAVANGATSEAAVQNLLELIQRIPLQSWK